MWTIFFIFCQKAKHNSQFKSFWLWLHINIFKDKGLFSYFNHNELHTVNIFCGKHMLSFNRIEQCKCCFTLCAFCNHHNALNYSWWIDTRTPVGQYVMNVLVCISLISIIPCKDLYECFLRISRCDVITVQIECTMLNYSVNSCGQKITDSSLHLNSFESSDFLFFRNNYIYLSGKSNLFLSLTEPIQYICSKKQYCAFDGSKYTWLLTNILIWHLYCILTHMHFLLLDLIIFFK